MGDLFVPDWGLKRGSMKGLKLVHLEVICRPCMTTYEKKEMNRDEPHDARNVIGQEGAMSHDERFVIYPVTDATRPVMTINTSAFIM